MTVYIAAPYPLIKQARALMMQLHEAGINCTSSWLIEDSMEDTEEAALLDLADIDRCDVFVAMNPESYRNAGTGGRHVEYGYALKSGKPIVVIGSRTNVFHRLRSCGAVETVEQLIYELKFRCA